MIMKKKEFYLLLVILLTLTEMDSTKKSQKRNPRQGANFLSQLLFLWCVPLLIKGSRNGLTSEDLTVCLDKDESKMLGDKLESEWTKEIINGKKCGRKPLLKYALFHTFKRSCYVNGVMSFCVIFLRCIVPVILEQLLRQLQTSNIQHLNKFNSTENRTAHFISGKDLKHDNNSFELNDFFSYIWNDIYWLSSGIVLITLLSCFLLHHSELRQRMVGARMRIACCSLVYRKVLRISKKAAGQTPTGYLINLLSNDVGRLDLALVYVHFIWILPIQALFIFYLLYRNIGIASVVCIVCLLIQTLPIQITFKKCSSILRLRIAKRTDRRVGIMNEIIQGILIIKMYAWEKPFEKVVAEARRFELNQISYLSHIYASQTGMLLCTMRLLVFVAIVACVLFDRTLTIDVVFSMTQLLFILELTAAKYFPFALLFGTEGLISVKRVEEFLLTEEWVVSSNNLIHDKKLQNKKSNIIELLNATASWSSTDQMTLSEISINVKSGKLCAIIGPVGSGKSSLLQLLLGEMPIILGKATVNGELSYGSQEPWLFTGTVRNNILFGLDYSRKRYNDVVRCCALLTDFEQFPNGDRTIVGERGVSLSGGQKARISLARSVYKEANIYLFDDPLSAVDAHVGRHLFEKVIGPYGYLAQEGATRLLVTHQIHFIKDADWIVIIDNGKIINQGTYTDLLSSNLDFGKLLVETNSPINENDELDGANDISQSNIGFLKRSLSRNSTKSLFIIDESNLKGPNEEHQVAGNVSYNVWKSYFQAGTNMLLLISLIITLITSQILISGTDYYVNYWIHQQLLRLDNVKTMFTKNESLFVYGILIIFVILMTTLRGFMFFNLCKRASTNLHNGMFSSLLNAPMRFFDTNPSGRILNRFSKDMGAVDELLPNMMLESVQTALLVIGILVMISLSINPLMLVALLCAVCFVGFILKMYFKQIQDLKRMEGITRSPVFSHLSATLTGLSTIRSNKILPEKVIEEFDHLQNVHSSVWQTVMSVNAALALWLDCVSTVFIACVISNFIVFEDSISSGLAITQSLILTGMIQHGVRQMAEAIQQMTNVERVLEYTNLEKETSYTNVYNRQLPDNWPAVGKISFNKLSLRYDKNEMPVLKNLNIFIESCWKVGVVGRTGAGKSSLINALFRLSHIEGEILIDDVDTSLINLNKLRQRISIIPQDPVLFSASIRYNLDPFNLYTDAELWASLTDVELKDTVKDLDFMVTASGSNFSVGERQLICLARAILRKNKILVLDEATANVDPKTDALIQTAIRVKFQDCTVLTVAHRLHTVMDSDRILVMEHGCAREYDSPYNLLQNPNSLFSSMVKATEQQESTELMRIAYESYQKINKMM